MIPFEKLMQSGVPIHDFSIQESSMETVVNQIESNEY